MSPLLLRPLVGEVVVPHLLLRALGGASFFFLPGCCARWGGTFCSPPCCYARWGTSCSSPAAAAAGGGGAFCRLFIHESDRILASACKGSPQVWCEIYGMQKSGPFSFSRYVKDTCSIVALRWCSANQYYYNIWRRQIDHRYTYTEADLTGLPRDADWTEFLASLPATGAMRTRAEGPDALRPRQPVSSP